MLKHFENLPPVRINLKAAGVFLNQYLVHQILMLVKKLKNLLPPQANSIDICLKAGTDQPAYPKIVTVRFDIPGPEVVVSESGQQWKVVLKNLEKKLMGQLEKRKAAVLT